MKQTKSAEIETGVSNTARKYEHESSAIRKQKAHFLSV